MTCWLKRRTQIVVFVTRMTVTVATFKNILILEIHSIRRPLSMGLISAEIVLMHRVFM
jgi:hypothetical protein